MRVGIATDHGGFELKETLVAWLRAAGHEVVDFVIRVRAWLEPVLEHDAVVAFAAPVAQFSSSMRADLAHIGGPNSAGGQSRVRHDGRIRPGRRGQRGQ